MWAVAVAVAVASRLRIPTALPAHPSMALLTRRAAPLKVHGLLLRPALAAWKLSPPTPSPPRPCPFPPLCREDVAVPTVMLSSGCELRPYQLDGLRFMASLYNNKVGGWVGGPLGGGGRGAQPAGLPPVRQVAMLMRMMP